MWVAFAVQKLLTFFEKMWVAFAVHIFSAKNFRKLYIESAKIVNEMALNELVKLTMLWTTGPLQLRRTDTPGRFSIIITRRKFLWLPLQMCCFVLLLFVPNPFCFWCLRIDVLCDCGLSWVISFVFFLFAFLGTKHLLKRMYYKREELAPTASKFFSFKSKPLFRRMEKYSDSVASPESVFIPFNYYNTHLYLH